MVNIEMHFTGLQSFYFTSWIISNKYKFIYTFIFFFGINEHCAIEPILILYGWAILMARGKRMCLVSESHILN